MTVHVKMPKRHHYIPEFILWNFADEDDWLHYFDKRAPNRIVRRGKPDELFQHRHLNSVIESDGRKDARLEGEFFGKLDDLAAPIVEKIVSTARAGRCPLLSPQEKETWDRFFYLQYKRTPDLAKKLKLLENFNENRKLHLDEYERATGKSLDRSTRDRLESPRECARAAHNALVRSRTLPGPDAVECLTRRGLAVGRISQLNKSFIIGSSPILKLTSLGVTHPSDHSVEIWFAIAHDIIVSPGLERGTERLLNVSSDYVRKLNVAIFGESDLIAGRSAELVARLARSWMRPTPNRRF